MQQFVGESELKPVSNYMQSWRKIMQQFVGELVMMATVIQTTILHHSSASASWKFVVQIMPQSFAPQTSTTNLSVVQVCSVNNRGIICTTNFYEALALL